jgi:hypothetical protein
MVPVIRDDVLQKSRPSIFRIQSSHRTPSSFLEMVPFLNFWHSSYKCERNAKQNVQLLKKYNAWNGTWFRFLRMNFIEGKAAIAVLVTTINPCVTFGRFEFDPHLRLAVLTNFLKAYLSHSRQLSGYDNWSKFKIPQFGSSVIQTEYAESRSDILQLFVSHSLNQSTWTLATATMVTFSSVQCIHGLGYKFKNCCPASWPNWFCVHFRITHKRWQSVRDLSYVFTLTKLFCSTVQGLLHKDYLIPIVVCWVGTGLLHRRL